MRYFGALIGLLLLAQSCGGGGSDDLREVTPTALGASGGPVIDLSSTPFCSPLEYVVQPGDTLLAISLEHGVELEALIAANQITDPNVIAAGQKLSIPCAVEATAGQ